jgi:sulfopyruvate decarboxylase TPP-binding subunit
MHIVEIPGHVSTISDKISAAAVQQALEEAGIEYLVTLPETSFELLLRNLIDNSPIKLIQVCRESEGMSICSGITYGGKKAALLCSYKGLYNSIDSLLGVAVKTESSFLILISEAIPSTESIRRDPERGRHSAALLEALQISYYEIRNNEGIPIIKQAIAQTYDNVRPVAVILRW